MSTISTAIDQIFEEMAKRRRNKLACPPSITSQSIDDFAKALLMRGLCLKEKL